MAPDRQSRRGTVKNASVAASGAAQNIHFNSEYEYGAIVGEMIVVCIIMRG